jgi:hypothetical protein
MYLYSFISKYENYLYNSRIYINTHNVKIMQRYHFHYFLFNSSVYFEATIDKSGEVYQFKTYYFVQPQKQ